MTTATRARRWLIENTTSTTASSNAHPIDSHAMRRCCPVTGLSRSVAMAILMQA